MKKLTLRQIIAKFPCVCCPLTPTAREDIEWIRENLDIAPRISDPHHLTSRGAGGQDTPENLVSLCREHHNEVEAPWGGIVSMIKKYPRLKDWLKIAGRTDILERGFTASVPDGLVLPEAHAAPGDQPHTQLPEGFRGHQQTEEKKCPLPQQRRK